MSQGGRISQLRSVRLSPAARAQLFVYRRAAGVYRGSIRARMAVSPPEAERATVLGERLGRWQEHADDERSVLWLHAASVGEVASLPPLVARLRARCPAAHLLVTCNTPSGRCAAARLGADEIRYFPLDHPAVVRPLLDRVRPALFVSVETEIWPGLLLELARRGLPAAIVNARISERSFPRYRMVAALMRATLGTLSVVCARDEVASERLVALGADPARIEVTGDLKLDALAGEDLAQTTDLLASISDGEPVLLAASTRSGEAEIVLKAFDDVRARHHRARLVLAPRHPERSSWEPAVAAAARRGLRVVAWSRHGADGASDWDVLVVDTIGELRGFMRSAVGAFVGGTFVDVGGHNVLEPAAFALPVVCGPHLDNVAEAAAALRDDDALTVVRDAAELAMVWCAWLEDPAGAVAAGRRGRELLECSRGAVDRTMSALDEVL